jgi:tRNA dimethylallyltransferase
MAIRLAGVFPGEIISCDSMQVYRGFDIGTDKISEENRGGVPHHLLDIVAPDQQFTAADFVRHALAAAAGIESRGRLPIIAGGTGLYLKALLVGLFPCGPVAPEIRGRLRERADRSGLAPLWEELKRIDPDYAATIGHRDRIRILRALEVYTATGEPLSVHFTRTKSPVASAISVTVGLELDRPELYARINDRVDRMFARGIVDEVRGLLADGVPPSSPPFRALGYAQVLKHLSGETGLEEAIDLTKVATRHYAKRQMTWFRRTPGVSWFSPHKPEEIFSHVRKRLPSKRKSPYRPSSD